MDEQEFSKLSRLCLTRVEDWAELFEPEQMDYEPADGLLKLEFPDGTQFVLNRQAGNHQMWFAAGVRAFHYDWNPESEDWLDDRDGHRLFDRLRTVVEEKLGCKVAGIDSESKS